MRTVLITAFEPFGSRNQNASAEVLRLLPDKMDGTVIRKMLLPVVFGKATERVLRQPADAVFLLGEAGSRNTVTPELQAVNIRNARIPDNAGNQPVHEKILPDGPEVYRTRVPVKRIVTRMRETGYNKNCLPCKIRQPDVDHSQGNPLLTRLCNHWSE